MIATTVRSKHHGVGMYMYAIVMMTFVIVTREGREGKGRTYPTMQA
jgi:hypothetical protein